MNYFRICLVFLGISKTEAVNYTAWTVWLWLGASLNEDPSKVWKQTGSPYNDANPMNVSDLVSSGANAYRSENVDSWDTNVPDLVRVTYRNSKGLPLFSAIFNGTAADWFEETEAIVAPYTPMPSALHCKDNEDFARFSTSFTFYEDSHLSSRYYASAVMKEDNTTIYVISSDHYPLYLPATSLSSGDCHLDYMDSNPLNATVTIPGLTRNKCSSYCREKTSFPYAAVHNDSCSCLATQPSGSGITSCNIPCDGNPNMMCGGYEASYPPGATIFNYLNTDIYSANFGSDTSLTENFNVVGVSEESFSNPYYVYGLQLQVAATNTPVNITIEIEFKAEACSSSFITNNDTITQTVSVFNSSLVTTTLQSGPIHLQCGYFKLFDKNYNPLSFNVDMTLITLGSGEFLTATYFSIEVSWEIEEAENTTDQTNTTLCECECWIYNMLYGTSSWNNLTYAEKEEALSDITTEIQKNLTVNKSKLSATKRAKISADDTRPSAVVVGYTMGAALLTLSIGLIVVSDIPKIVSSIHVLIYNVKSRFSRSNSIVSDAVEMENS